MDLLNNRNWIIGENSTTIGNETDGNGTYYIIFKRKFSKQISTNKDIRER
jgi:hypothetical protein